MGSILGAKYMCIENTPPILSYLYYSTHPENDTGCYSFANIFLFKKRLLVIFFLLGVDEIRGLCSKKIF
jgi:hypothetical protein